MAGWRLTLSELLPDRARGTKGTIQNKAASCVVCGKQESLAILRTFVSLIDPVSGLEDLIARGFKGSDYSSTPSHLSA